jgi:hypothetical protein
MGDFAGQLAQITEMAQQFAPQAPMPPDNSMQIAQLNAELQGQVLQQRAQTDQARIQLDQQKMATDLQLEQQKMSIQQQKDTSQLQNEQFKQQAENERTIAEITARERMNTADNETAMLLAAAEMSTGEKVAVSTGTGINPNP